MGEILSPRGWTVLLVVALERAATRSEIDRHVLITPGTASSHLERLKELGLVSVSGRGDRSTYQPTIEGFAVLGDIEDLPHFSAEVCHGVA